MKNAVEQRLEDLGQQRLLPQAHVDYLNHLKRSGTEPKVIYDLGSCVLHWYQEAKAVWPQARYCLAEAMPDVEFLYKQHGLDYHLGVLSNSDRRTVTFWQNVTHPGGNSYYRENQAHNPQVDEYFPESTKRLVPCRSLDSVIREKKWPLPDLVKMDVQGAEQDVLMGMTQTLPHVKDLILELQNVEYNQGAPLASSVVEWLDQKGFDCVAALFSNNGPDGDYHFRRRL